MPTKYDISSCFSLTRMKYFQSPSPPRSSNTHTRSTRPCYYRMTFFHYFLPSPTTRRCYYSWIIASSVTSVITRAVYCETSRGVQYALYKVSTKRGGERTGWFISARYASLYTVHCRRHVPVWSSNVRNTIAVR